MKWFAYSSRKAYMSLISVIVAIVVIGFLLWLVETYVPMPIPIKRVLEAVVVLVLVLWLLQAFGLLRGSGIRF